VIPIAIAAYLWGRAPGCIATVVATAGAAILLGPPELGLADVQRIVLVTVNGALISVLTGGLHAARARAEEEKLAQRAANAALLTSEQRFSTAFNASPLPSAIVRTADRRVIAVNDAGARWMGRPRDALVGTKLEAVGLPRAELQALVARLEVAGGVRGEKVHPRTARGVRTVLASCERIELDGEPHSMVVFDDITEREQTEAACRESEERFAKAFDGSPLASAIARVSDRTLLAVNDAFVRISGFSRDELLGRRLIDVDFHADPDVATRVNAQCVGDGHVPDVEARFRRKDGTLIDALWSVELIEIGGEPFFLGIWQDVTERRRAEAALREGEARFRQLAENIREVFWLYDMRDERIVYVSPAYEAVWGRPSSSLLADPADWTSAIVPEDRERVGAVSKRIDYDQQYRIVRPDGNLRWIRDRAFPVRDENGTIIRIAGLAEDITERRALEDQLRQTQKMESLGMLAGGVAHDFNNLLAVIASCNGILAETLPKQGEAHELVQEVDAAVTRATALTRQLLAFSRKQVAEPKVIDINATVNDTRKMLRRMVGEDVALQVSLEPELRTVRADPGYLVQVLMNLVVNARDAMPRGGELEITTCNAVIDEAFARAHLGAKAGPAVLLCVADTGTGIAPDVLSHIFEPFFTTKEHGRGTGMGLAVVHGIVEQAGGFIEVESEVGEGSTFKVYLPALAVAADAVHETSGALSRGFETILVVDDDEYVRRSAARALRGRGYNVLEAADASSALGHLTTTVDLLVTDVVMPKMDGRQLADAARARVPGLKVLFTTGYTDDAVVRHGVMHGEVDLLEKPFRVRTLAARVRQLLDR
jgi:PAS domain S-box-containing protein